MVGPSVLRNVDVPVEVPDGGLVILRDGDPGAPEVLMSPPSYTYEHEAEVEIFAQSEDVDTDFDALKVALGTVLAADRTLGGLCDWVEADAPEPSELPFAGALSVKAALIPVRITYTTSDPLI